MDTRPVLGVSEVRAPLLVDVSAAESGKSQTRRAVRVVTSLKDGSCLTSGIEPPRLAEIFQPPDGWTDPAGPASRQPSLRRRT